MRTWPICDKVKGAVDPHQERQHRILKTDIGVKLKSAQKENKLQRHVNCYVKQLRDNDNNQNILIEPVNCERQEIENWTLLMAHQSKLRDKITIHCGDNYRRRYIQNR